MEQRQFDFEASRERLVQHLRREIDDERVLEAIRDVPRHLFIPAGLQKEAYSDRPLPIGDGQTISQPFIVALMTQAAKIQEDEVVLEIGTGSGYQTAILCKMARLVISVERFPALADKARDLLRSLGYWNFEIHLAGPELGWKPGGPYDCIMVTAAAPSVPQALLDQLKDGGRMIIPVGSRHDQDLLSVTKLGDNISRRSLGPCRFVPLVGREAWETE